MALIHLYNPPGSDIAQPYSSIACLAAFLRKAGFPVRTFDFNIDFFDTFLNSDKVSSEAERYLSGIPSSNDTVYFELLSKEIDNAKKILRCPELFYDYPSLNRAIGIVSGCIDLLDKSRGPTVDEQLEALCNISSWAEELRRISSDSTNTPYPEYYRQYYHTLSGCEQDTVLVGISVTYHSQLVPAVSLATVVREMHPGIPIVFGGAFLSELDEAIEEDPQFFNIADFVIVREGETALLMLLKAIQGKMDLKDVPNLMYREGKSTVITPKTFYCERIDELPSPDYTDHPLSKYFSPEPVLLLPTDRGCWWGKCAYCTCSLATSTKYRVRSVDKIISDMRRLNATTGTQLFFLSADSMQPKHLKSLARKIKHESLPYRWATNALLTDNLLSEAECVKLAEGGCRLILFGMESSNQRVLNLMNKGVINSSNFATILKNCQSAGIAPHIMAFSGFPGETKAEAEETVNFLINNSGNISSVGFGPFILNKKSKIFKQPSKYGISLSSITSNKFKVRFDYSVNSGMSPKEAASFAVDALNNIQSQFAYNLSTFTYGCHYLLYLCHHRVSRLSDIPCLRAKLTNDQIDKSRFISVKMTLLETKTDTTYVVVNIETGEKLVISIKLYNCLINLLTPLSLHDLIEQVLIEYKDSGYYQVLYETARLICTGYEAGLIKIA